VGLLPTFSQIRIGQVFRVVHGVEDASPEGRSYQDLTRGRHQSSADVQKGIWGYKPIRTERGTDRVPALILHTNTFKEGSEITPWIDTVEPDSGYALFHGDNRRATQGPFDSRGNNLLLRLFHACADRATRAAAPPILLFQQSDVGGKRKGFRSFAGFGIPSRLTLVSQQEKGTGLYFTNVLAELALFRLEHERELFDWGWIDARRDPSVSDDEALRLAPHTWRQWVEAGGVVLERCRRRVTHHDVVPPSCCRARRMMARQPA
jgi:hypothetical protein